jgi:hypothetical protein
MTDELKDQSPAPVPARPHKVGPGTTSSKVKHMWKETCFSPDKQGKLHRNGRWQSLKAFAEGLLNEGNELVSKWFANKSGANNAKRSEEKISQMAELAAKSGKKKL